jgi:hypothetical protein
LEELLFEQTIAGNTSIAGKQCKALQTDLRLACTVLLSFRKIGQDFQMKSMQVLL